jgi:hypothetical protein
MAYYLVDFFKFFIFFSHFSDGDVEIFSIKSSDEGFVFINSKSPDDILSDFLCCGCGKGNDWEMFSLTKGGNKLFYLEVAWAEIVSPLAYTVGFIYCKKTDRRIFHCLNKSSIHQSFGGDIEKFYKVFLFEIFIYICFF